MTIPERVAAHLGKGGDATVLALAGEHVAIITAMVKAYTRGRGFVGTIPAPDVEAVIVTASARFTANPEQVERYQAADYAETPREAAQEAWRAMRRVDSQANVFTVMPPDGMLHTIDLGEDPP